MPKLRFKKKGVGVCSIVEDGPRFPFEKDEKVIVSLEVIPMELFPEDGLPNAVWKAELHPLGDFENEISHLRIDVKSLINPSKSL